MVLKGKRIPNNLVILLVYIALLISMTCFHEPWFDEAQAWMIARESTLKDLLIKIPHLEGHPSFWWLLLAVPAKTGVPYEVGIKTIEVVFASFACYLLVFKSPFPRCVRYLLPFTYFLFYQYGIQARPYSIMMCAVFLSAITWSKRDTRPFRFCGALGLLCLSSSYGIIIAGGLAIVWTGELLWKKELFNNRKRILALAVLLLVALFLIWTIIPEKNTFGISMYNKVQSNSTLIRILYFLTCTTAEAAFTSFASSDYFFYCFRPRIVETCFMTIITALIWIGTYRVCKGKNTFRYLLIPYLLFAVFSSVVYFCMHHIGIVLLLFVFCLWISYRPEDWVDWRDKTLLNKGFTVFMAIGLGIGIIWNTTASVKDIIYAFSPGRELADFIEDHDLQRYGWIAVWYNNTHSYSQVIIETNPYLEEPLLNGKLNGHGYTDHDIPSEETMEKELESLKKEKIEIIIGIPNDAIYTQCNINEKFTLGRILNYNRIWKNKNEFFVEYILMSKEALEQLKE